MVMEMVRELDHSVRYVSAENLENATFDIDYHANDFHANRQKPWSSTQLTFRRKQDGWHLANARSATIRNAKDRVSSSLSQEALREQLQGIYDEAKKE